MFSFFKPALIKELISLGGISTLDINVKPLNPKTHSFDNREIDCTIAYNRDRGDEIEIDLYNSISKWSVHAERLEWNYIWRKGAWYFQGSINKKGNLRLKELTEKHLNIDV